VNHHDQAFGQPPLTAPAQRGRDRAVAAVLTAASAILTGLTLWGLASAQPGDSMFALDVAAGVAACCLMPALTRWPLPAGLGLAVLAALSAAATPPATTAALWVAQRRPFRVAVAVGAAGALGHLVRWAWRPPAGLSFGWWLLLVTATYAALIGWGALSQARRVLIGSLRERAQRAEAEQGRRVAEARAAERTRMAREMHDVLAHRLSLLATYAGALEYRPDAPPAQLSTAAGVIRASVHDALTDLREVIAVLRDDAPAEGDDGQQRPQPVLADVPALVAESRQAGTSVDLDSQVSDPAALPAATGRTAYRIVQEALTNARKHAPGQPVRVRMAGRPGARLTIEIANPLSGDGSTAEVPGNAVLAGLPGTGSGLIGLTERARLAGGQLDHQAAAGEFRLSAWLPWPA
jgi:signal transduction histidine kinase